MNYAEYFTYFILILVIIAMLYFPKKRQEKQIRKMQEEIKVGDKIVTYSGLVGEIVLLQEDTIVIKTEPEGIKLTITKWSIIEVNN